MAELGLPDDDLEPALAGVDEPRPLPADLAARLRAGLSEPLLLGLDEPRPLPEALRSSLTAAVLAVGAGAGRTAGATWVRRIEARRRLVAAAAVVVLLLGGVALAGADDGDDRPVAVGAVPSTSTSRPSPGPGRPPSTTTTTVPPVLPAPETEPDPASVPLVESDPEYARLANFVDCRDLLRWVHGEAGEAVGPYGLQLGGGGSGEAEFARPAQPAVQPPPGTSQPVASLGRAADRTNVQEAGVDEPDLLEVGEGTLYVLTDTSVHAVLTGGGGAVNGGSVPVADPAGGETPLGMLRDGSMLVVLVAGRGGGGGQRFTMVRSISLADPANPTIVDTTVVDGAYVDARLAGGRLHLVTSWQPGPFEFTYAGSPSAADEAASEAHNRDVIAASTVEQWVPPSLGCDQVARPRDLAGFSTTLVTTIATGDLTEHAALGLLADAGTVYATAESLVVATTRWEYIRQELGWTSTVRTNLHRFALDAAGPRYLASGSVEGYLRSSYSLDEDDEGNLRVAATERAPWEATTEPGLSSVSVLRQQDDVLVTIGYLGGLGAAGEQIQGVRFAGDVGFVVTFRRTDPLYVIDLSRPDRPLLRGALSVTGFSAYLHPLGGGLLLGAGVEADEGGRVTGAALSLYDVGDPDSPTMPFRATVAGTRFAVEQEPHAIVVDDATSRVVLPARCADDDPSTPASSCFDVFVLTEGGIAQVARVDHSTQFEGPVIDTAYRAAVIDGVVYTVSGGGVLASDATTFAVNGWAPFPPGPPATFWPTPFD